MITAQNLTFKQKNKNPIDKFIFTLKATFLSNLTKSVFGKMNQNLKKRHHPLCWF